MLDTDGVGKRSGTRPFLGLAVSQKKRNVRSSRSIRNGSTTGLRADVADEYVNTSFKSSLARLDVNRKSRMTLVAISARTTRRWCDRVCNVLEPSRPSSRAACLG